MYIPGTIKVFTNRQPTSVSNGASGIEASCEVEIVFQDNNPRIHPIIILGYDIIPRRGMYYNFDGIRDTRFVATKQDVEKITSGLTQWWKVTMTYEFKGAPDFPVIPDPDDFSGGVTIKRALLKIPTVVFRDLVGNPALNSAGMPFDPPYQRDRYLRGFTISRKEYINPYIKCDTYERRVNSKEFWGFEPGTVLIEKIDPVLSITGIQGYFQWDVTYDIIIDTGIHGYDKDKKPITGHDLALLDNGTRERDEEGKLHPILDDSGVEIDQPVRLDGKGKVLKSGEKNVYIPVVHFFDADLNELCLPNPYKISSY